MLSDLWFRLRAFVRRAALEDELHAELTFHFERQIEKNIRAGMTPEEALRQARMAFGGMTQVKEHCREAWGTGFLDTLGQDIGYGARLLVRNLGFSTTALVTLALGLELLQPSSVLWMLYYFVRCLIGIRRGWWRFMKTTAASE